MEGGVEGESERIIRYRDVRGKKRLGRGAGVDGFDDVTPRGHTLHILDSCPPPGYHASRLQSGWRGRSGATRHCKLA